MVSAVQFIDTHNGLITALATICIAYFTYSLKTSTDQLWDAGERQLGIAVKAVKEAERSSNIADAQLEMAHRPWLPPSMVVTSNLNVIDGTVKISVSLKFTNTGNSPAFNVIHDNDVSLNSIGQTDLRELQSALAEKLLKTASQRKAAKQPGDTIFPNESGGAPIMITISPEMIKAAKGGEGVPSIIYPTIFGSIAYESRDGAVYQTGFGYLLLMVEMNTQPGMLPFGHRGIPIDKGDIPGNQITPMKFPGLTGRTT